MRYLFILNDPPYGTERTYNALRLAINLQKMKEEATVTVFLLGDGASASKSGQQTPNGYYNIERMLKSVINKGGSILVCGTCMDARGITEPELVAGAHRSTMDALTELTIDANKVLVF